MKDAYRSIAPVYDTLLEPFTASLRRRAVQVARPREGMRVLEVGCGTGTNLEIFAEAGCRIAGVDLSPSMMHVAKKKLHGRADLRLGDAAKLPFAENAFDLVVSFLTLHEMPAARRISVMHEMVRAIHGDGRLLLVDFYPGPFRFPRGWLYRAAIFSIEFGAGWEHFQNHLDFIARNGLPSLLNEVGLWATQERFLLGGTLHAILAKPK